MKVMLIIQARMGSTRLKGKVMKRLGDRSVLSHVVNRAQSVPSVTQVVVATTASEQDDIIVEETARIGVSCTRGSEENVLMRYYEAATTFNADHIIRVTSDCPLIDPTIIEELIQYYFNHRLDYARIGLDSYPRGVDAEIFSMDALAEAFKKADTPFFKEHVTTYIRAHEDKFKCGILRGSENASHLRLTLDTEEDWQLISEIFSTLYEGEGIIFHLDKVIELMKRKPELALINQCVEQKHHNI